MFNSPINPLFGAAAGGLIGLAWAFQWTWGGYNWANELGGDIFYGVVGVFVGFLVVKTFNGMVSGPDK